MIYCLKLMFSNKEEGSYFYDQTIFGWAFDPKVQVYKRKSINFLSRDRHLILALLALAFAYDSLCSVEMKAKEVSELDPHLQEIFAA